MKESINEIKNKKTSKLKTLNIKTKFFFYFNSHIYYL